MLEHRYLCFAVLDFVGDHIQKHQVINVRQVSNDILHQYAPRVDFTCIVSTMWNGYFLILPPNRLLTD